MCKIEWAFRVPPMQMEAHNTFSEVLGRRAVNKSKHFPNEDIIWSLINALTLASLTSAIWRIMLYKKINLPVLYLFHQKEDF